MIPSQVDWEQALSERQGESYQKKFASATVAVCGLGGLGSNIATALARAGVGKLLLIDDDSVALSNLHRQQYKASQIGMKKTEACRKNLLEIAPYLVLETHAVRITETNAEELLNKADIICEAFDDPEAKAMLVNFVLERWPRKYMVAASGMAGIGSANNIKTRRITGKFYLCGDEASDVRNEGCLFAPRVMLCASHQAHIILRILAEACENDL